MIKKPVAITVALHFCNRIDNLNLSSTRSRKDDDFCLFVSNVFSFPLLVFEFVGARIPFSRINFLMEREGLVIFVVNYISEVHQSSFGNHRNFCIFVTYRIKNGESTMFSYFSCIQFSFKERI